MVHKPILKLESITKTYGKGHTKIIALDSVNLDIFPGEVVLIMGPSGSGKTTLLTIAGALLKPTSGKVIIGNKEISHLSEKKLPKIRRKNIGFIFQTANLLEALSAKENVEIAFNLKGIKGKEAARKASELLLGLGLDDRLNFRPSKLSGGEAQRVSIARAITGNPSLILADEPTANLDSKNGSKVMQILKDIAKKEKKTVVIVSHDMRIMDVADRVLWLSDGKLKEGGISLVTDPVCKMRIQKETAPYKTKYKEKTFYFCSRKCKDFFEDNPEGFLH